MRALRLLTKLLAAVLFAGLLSPFARAQTYQSQIAHPIVRYRMTARLDPATRTVTGHYTLTWWNHTEDSIPDLYFHLYLNAFKNLDSSFMRESAERRRPGQLERWLARGGAEKWGWEDVNKLQIVGGADLTAAQTFVHPDDNNAQDQTVMRVALPQPIPPHGTIELAVDFTSKLPLAVARSGYEGNYFLIAQWFPKIGVYEGAGERDRAQGGWNCHPYHANTEFYADYGVYDVELTAPSNFVVGATGFMRSFLRNPDGTTTYHFFQEDVHDFAWAASPRFHREVRTFDWGKEVRGDEVVHWSQVLNLPAQDIRLRNVQVALLLEPGHRNLADRYFRALFNGLKYFGLWYGRYPYDTLTVVETPRNSATCCMEYPTFITVAGDFWPGKHALSPEGVTVHEFGHQFWYGLVGNNEFEEPWLDEGFNTYSTGKVLEKAYGAGCHYERVFGIPIPGDSWLTVKLPRFPFAGVPGIPMGLYFSCVGTPERTSGRDFYLHHATDDDLVRNGWEYLNGSSYGVNSYTRTGLTLRTLESYLGADVMARVMRTYQERWRYRHPDTQDFIQVVNEVSGRDMNWFFQQFFYAANRVDYAVTEIRNGPVLGKVGDYDQDGKKVFYSAQAAEKAAAGGPPRYRSTVVVRRLGGARAPVDVVVHFQHGGVVRDHWDGQYRWTKLYFQGPDKVVSAEVDPLRKLALDANFTNNSLLEGQDNRAAAKWYVRWIFWVENLFFAAGFFS
jgi:hypothetical protein